MKLEETTMPFVIGAIVLVGLLCTVDLVLTLGVVKRLREHTEMLSNMGNTATAIGVGDVVGQFSTSTVDHEPLSPDLFTGETVVAFLSPDCGPCNEKLPKFVEFARARPDGRNRAVAVVVGGTDQAAPFVAELAAVARVVVEEPDGPVGAAFNVKAYPAVLEVAPNGAGRLVVTADRVDLDQLPLVV
ncbi:TlpA family protein disulfide reductase [Planosporangium sp. 12N6]|uniref:TlpA family protein disulfide reductase n=1 Tax=Planosporangium spinosum TaxID=3402278 RepID=UPI003CEB4803